MGHPSTKGIWLKSKISTDVSEGEIKINPENLNKLRISSGEEIELKYGGEVIKAIVKPFEDVPEDEVYISAPDLKSLDAQEEDALRLSPAE